MSLQRIAVSPAPIFVDMKIQEMPFMFNCNSKVDSGERIVRNGGSIWRCITLRQLRRMTCDKGVLPKLAVPESTQGHDA